ncbi:hypothetical protein [Oligoflexus tunisiensis]|uniref:hypothetical protein n=1 Tax=Oligoflexus tunisiensis TaxID=708132 RepID=UPI00114D3227|nr:hypothetical protein [Oligoflexus tunisiensis]
MAKTIGAYKGLWKQPAPQADHVESDADVMMVSVASPSGEEEQDATVATASQLTERISIPIKSQAPIVKAAVNSQPIAQEYASLPEETNSATSQPMQNATVSAAPQQPETNATSYQTQTPTTEASPNSPAQDTAVPQHPIIQESPDLLAHRYRMLVLREHRHKLGRDLLDLGHRNPWALAWSSFTSLGRSFRPWAHARIFALGCYLGVEMAPEILKQLRHPLWLGRYRRSMRGLWRLLELMAQRSGQKPVSRFLFRLFYLCPPLGVLIYEKQLQSVLRKAQGASSAVASGMVKATQGQ